MHRETDSTEITHTHTNMLVFDIIQREWLALNMDIWDYNLLNMNRTQCCMHRDRQMAHTNTCSFENPPKTIFTLKRMTPCRVDCRICCYPFASIHDGPFWQAAWKGLWPFWTFYLLRTRLSRSSYHEYLERGVENVMDVALSRGM